MWGDEPPMAGWRTESAWPARPAESVGSRAARVARDAVRRLTAVRSLAAGEDDMPPGDAA